jgi:hypothetical protein
MRCLPKGYGGARRAPEEVTVPVSRPVQAIPLSTNSFFARSFLVRCVRPMPRSTLGALVNWTLS